MPASNVEYWEKKFRANVERDRKHRRALKRLGWQVVVVWECEVKDPDKLTVKLAKALTAAVREARGARTRRK
jgi:DNA mismatch endonuclease (patch repair protein)